MDVAKKAGCYFVSAVDPTSSRLWHQRLGHLSNKSLHAISLSAEIMHFCLIDDCSICPLAKQTRNPFPLSSINTKAPFELIHVDIWGGYHVPTLDGARYFLTIVDDFSRCTLVYLLHHKSDTRRFLTTFINLVETQFESRIKIIRSDKGPEFDMTKIFSEKGILHQTSCVSTPQQNGVVEGKHSHLLNVACALLFKPIFQSIFGVMPFSLPHTSSTVHLHQFLMVKRHTISFFTNHLHINIYVCLVVYVLLPRITTVPQSLMLDPPAAYSLGIRMALRVIRFMI